MGSSYTKLEEDREYTNKVHIRKSYEYDDYTPLHYDGNNTSFVSIIKEITPEKILFLYRPNKVIGTYWFVLDQEHYKSVKIGSEIRRFENKDYTYLVIPKDIICYFGIVGEYKEDSIYLPGSNQQFYIPLQIVRALEPFSVRFRSRPKSRNSENKYIKEIKPVLEVQDNYIKNYLNSLKHQNDFLMLIKLEDDILHILKITSEIYNNLSYQNLVLEIDNTKKRALNTFKNTSGDIKDEVSILLSNLMTFQDIVVDNISKNTKWGNNFEDILEICKVRNDPKIGNLFYTCNEDFINIFFGGEYTSTVENIEHIIHRRKDGYIVKVRIYRDNGINNFAAEFYE